MTSISILRYDHHLSHVCYTPLEIGIWLNFKWNAAFTSPLDIPFLLGGNILVDPLVTMFYLCLYSFTYQCLGDLAGSAVHINLIKYNKEIFNKNNSQPLAPDPFYVKPCCPTHFPKSKNVLFWLRMQFFFNLGFRKLLCKIPQIFVNYYLEATF